MSKLVQKLKTDLIDAMKQKDKVKKDIITVVLGEVSKILTHTVSDDNVVKIIEKLITLNEQLLVYRPDDKLVRENEILSTYVIKKVSEEELETALQPVLDQVKAQAKSGEANKIAINYLKSIGLPFDGKIVNKLVEKIRA